MTLIGRRFYAVAFVFHSHIGTYAIRISPDWGRVSPRRGPAVLRGRSLLLRFRADAKVTCLQLGGHAVVLYDIFPDVFVKAV